ncbi:MAG: MFS transporter [Bacteroidota bacterium]
MQDKLPLRTHFAYGIGDFGQNMVFQIVTIFLLPFYTDIMLLAPVAAGNIFLIARFWDAINDPLMGLLAQRTRTRWGTYRPYLLFAGIPTAIALVLLFVKPFDDPDQNFWYAFFTYLIFGMAFTALNIPYGTLSAVITDSYHERIRLNGFRMTFALAGGLAIGLFAQRVIGLSENVEQGHIWMAMAVGGILLTGLLITFFGIKEPIREQLSHRGESFTNLLKVLRRNRPFWLMTATFGCCFIALAIFSSMILFYFEHVQGAKDMGGTAIFWYMGGNVVSVPIWSWLAGRLGKKGVFLLGASLSIVGFFCLYFVPSGEAGWAVACLSLHGLGNGAAAFSSWAMPADTVDYGEYKTGVRAEGVSYGVYGFFLKLGIGVGLWMSGVGLEMSGYVANAVQSVESIEGIRLLISLAPMCFIALAMFCMLFYTISAKRHTEIQVALEEKNHHPTS